MAVPTAIDYKLGVWSPAASIDESQMPRVFIPQVTGRYSQTESGAPRFVAHDHSDIGRFGDALVIFRRDLYPDNAADLIAQATDRAFRVLRTWQPSDYLCLMGSPLYMALCSVVMGHLGNLPCRMLRYDKMHSAYYEVIVPTIEEIVHAQDQGCTA